MKTEGSRCTFFFLPPAMGDWIFAPESKSSTTVVLVRERLGRASYQAPNDESYGRAAARQAYHTDEVPPPPRTPISGTLPWTRSGGAADQLLQV